MLKHICGFTVFLMLITNADANLNLVGRAMPGEAEATFVADTLCLVGAANQVQIFSISNPQNPHLISYQTIPGTASDIYVSGDYAYVAAEHSGFVILNISNIQQPELVSVTSLNTSVFGIFYKDSKAYLATLDSGLVIYDVVDPQFPFKLSSCQTFHTVWATLNVYVQGDYAYVAAAYDGFSIIDISDPLNPQQVYLYDVQNFWAYDVEVKQSWVYLSYDTYSSGAGLLTFQVPVDPANTQQAGQENTNTSARRVDIGNGYAYVACRNGGMNVIDISNPYSPVLANVWLHGNSNNLYYRDNHVYLADKYQGLHILDVTNVNNIMLRGKYDTHSYSQDVAVVGNHLFMVERDPAALKVFDVSDKTIPSLLHDETFFPDEGGVASGITADSNYLYVSSHATITGGDHQFRWYKHVDPTQPQLIGVYEPTQGIRAHDVQGEKAYVGSGGYLWVLDLSVEQNPIPVLGEFSNSYSSIRSIRVRGTMAYLATKTTGFRIINIEHPTAMFEMGALSTTDRTMDVAVEGNYAYLAEWEAGFRTVDISNPWQPTALDSVQPAGQQAKHVAVQNDTAYVAWDGDGIRLYDVSDPYQIVEIDYYQTADPEMIYLSDTYVYVADDNRGLFIFKKEPLTPISKFKENNLPHDFSLNQNYPNPFNLSTSIEFYLPRNGNVSLKIYDITGQLIQTLIKGRVSGGFHNVRWDGKDKKNREMPSGIYLYKLEFEGQRWVRKMTLIK